MTSLNCQCQGYSHIETGKPCQDNSFSEVNPNGIAFAIISDGHGGKRYFRSEVGSKFITGIARDKMMAFISNFGDANLKGTPFTQRKSIKTQIEDKDFDKQGKIDKAFRQLFGSIIYEWNRKVEQHAANNPLTDKERRELEADWIKDFENKEKLEKVYGCTLIATAFTPSYWFAFQIGDGKCFTVDEKGQWIEPIPWDDRCFLNKTTSICDTDALNEFRYCYAGDGTIPVSIFLASDGLDDSFGSEENQENFYVQILKSLIKTGKFKTLKDIEEALPELSKKGSKDDMSIAMLYNEKKLKNMYKIFLQWQIANLKRHIEEQNKKIEASNKDVEALEAIPSPTPQNLIDLQYAQKDNQRALEEKSRLLERLTAMKEELDKL
ncbi:MAG: protein phosphatase 2C domain-containing protein [Muribaculaceae bacterium]|nr:protein phosphatase 2C domain-containing protein [Muribaculaceae bacterium]